MGNYCNAISFWKKRQAKIMLIGLDAVGKTTLLYRAKGIQYVDTIPTNGYNVQTIETNNINYVIYDVGGGCKIRQLWKHYFQMQDAIIFLIDATDQDRIYEAKHQLVERILLEPQAEQKIVLVLVNKTDTAKMTNAQILAKLEIETYRTKKCGLRFCSAIKNQGIKQAFQWIQSQLIGK